MILLIPIYLVDSNRQLGTIRKRTSRTLNASDVCGAIKIKIRLGRHWRLA